ncbi:MAG: ABC transporter ATP-binding protein [Calditrichaeota bacterium]|nr:ABC transporter ATP-binding protein [Calditrichota bacterium]
MMASGENTLPIIEIQQLKKRFGTITALDGIDLHIYPGEIFGLIGPDGAGKTTLIRILCTLLLPDAGRVQLLQHDVVHDVQSIRRFLGYMPQRFSLYPDLTVEQNLNFFADLFQVPPSIRQQRIQQLYHFSRLEPFKNRPTRALSGGMKQKLALSCAMIHTPKILILDEPTTGVDPLSRQEFWHILHQIREGGTTVLVSTPYMEEADQCDRVGLMYRGKLIVVDTPQRVRQRFPYPLYRVWGQDTYALREFFQNLETVHSVHLFGDALHVAFTQPPVPSDWKHWQLTSHQQIIRWQPIEASVEDVFLEMMEAHS